MTLSGKIVRDFKMGKRGEWLINIIHLGVSAPFVFVNSVSLKKVVLMQIILACRYGKQPHLVNLGRLIFHLFAYACVSAF